MWNVTRKDYQLLADAIARSARTGHVNRAACIESCESIINICESLSAALKQDNARFNPQTSLKACGYSIAELNVTTDLDDIE